MADRDIPARQVHETFDAASDTILRARRLLRTWLDVHHLDSLRTDIPVAVGELVTNAVVHGKAPIHLVLSLGLDRIRIEVHDAGGGHPAIRPNQRPGPHAGGWGLHMVDELVDTWGTHTRPDATIIWIERSIPPAGPVPRDH